MGSPIYTSGHIPGREIPPSLINAESEPPSLAQKEDFLVGGEGLDFSFCSLSSAFLPSLPPPFSKVCHFLGESCGSLLPSSIWSQE